MFKRPSRSGKFTSKINNDIYTLLLAFENKAGCIHTQYVAGQIRIKLKKLLTEEQYWKLSLAHSHYRLGEGAEELYDVVRKLKKEYKPTYSLKYRYNKSK